MTKSLPIRPTHHDNRGSMKHPFGYVYFNDGTRTAYAITPEGSGAFGDGYYNLFTDWEPQNERHLELAEVYLSGAFEMRPEWYPDSAPSV